MVFLPSVGRFHVPCTLVRRFHQLVTLAGVLCTRLHNLRHTAASLLVRRGGPIKAEAERLGRMDASLTRWCTPMWTRSRVGKRRCLFRCCRCCCQTQTVEWSQRVLIGEVGGQPDRNEWE